MAKLSRLHIVTLVSQQYQLNETYRTSFRAALTGQGPTGSFGMPIVAKQKEQAPSSKAITIDFLDSFAKSRWETILHYMVGTEMKQRPGDSVLTVLTYGGLMKLSESGKLSITNNGFQFLLQDTNTQLWTFLLHYLNATQDTDITDSSNASETMDPVDVLHYIFLLGSLELGQDYAASDLTETQQSMLPDLRDYGLIYQANESSNHFHPTRLATSLTSESGTFRTASESITAAVTAGDSTDAQSGYLILESNYRIYAYTDSPLQIAILNLFVSLKLRFINMVTGVITRESVRQAFAHGITAEQIIYFIRSNAHPQMRKQVRWLSKGKAVV